MKNNTRGVSQGWLRAGLLLLGWAWAVQGAYAGDASAKMPGQVSLSGTEFLRDGQPWVPRGVGITGLVLVDKLVASGKGRPPLIASHNMFGPALLDAVKAYGADSVRVAVSQPGLNPSDPLYDPGYADEVAQKIRLMRQRGLVVFVFMQWEPGTGSHNQSGLTSDPATLAAWHTLLHKLPLDDHGIVLEPLNEPNHRGEQGAAPGPQVWASWQSGMQKLVNAIRGEGWSGVMLIDGAYGSSWLDGAPAISDPQKPSQLAWSVHVYFTKSFRFVSQPDWDQHFGDTCRAAACVVTEFQAARHTDCSRKGNNREMAEALVRYLKNRRIGLMPWAFDYENTMMEGHSLSQTTRYPKIAKCNKDGDDEGENFGNGELVHQYFTSGRVPEGG
ncbi:MAG TPA: cellulase family glycosylhydrolase [Nevskiaceae bacterium]|nr:cellulase family glycosylhydrolase [Nevskiaceae bacterium]